MRILLVDDEATVLEALAEVLEDLGHTVTCKADGEQALAEVLSEPYDLLVTDIRMPGMNGLELVEALRSRSLDVPVIIASGHVSMEVAALGPEVGVLGYLPKPIRVADLVAVIRALETESQPGAMGSE